MSFHLLECVSELPLVIVCHVILLALLHLIHHVADQRAEITRGVGVGAVLPVRQIHELRHLIVIAGHPVSLSVMLRNLAPGVPFHKSAFVTDL